MGIKPINQTKILGIQTDWMSIFLLPFVLTQLRKEFGPMWRKFQFALVIALVFSIIFSGCSVEKEEDLWTQIQKRGTIKIGTEGTYRPFSFHGQDNQLTGFDVEVAKELAKRMGVKAEFVETPWDGMLSSLQTKKIDTVANQVGIKPERKDKLDFSDPYTISYAQIVVHKDNSEIQGIKDLKGKVAGQTLTSNFGKYSKDAGAQVKGYETFDDTLKDVVNRRIDFTINDRTAIAEALKKSNYPVKTVGDPIEKVYTAFPVPKNNPKLLQEINKALESMKKDGTLTNISKKWFGMDITK